MIKKKKSSPPPPHLEDVTLVSEDQGEKTNGDLTKRLRKETSGFMYAHMNPVLICRPVKTH